MTVLTMRWTSVALLALALLTGLVIARDYGISWDEKAMHVLGEEAFEFVFQGGEYPSNAGIRYHGAWFEILQYGVEYLMGLRYARHIYILRHGMNYAMFWIGLVSVYCIALRSFRHRGWALLTTLFLFFSPRVFGHAFINGRDIPAMVCFALKISVLLWFADQPSPWRGALLGLASGLILSLRVGGLFVPLYVVVVMLLLAAKDIHENRPIPWTRYARILGTYAVFFLLSTIALWPLLWDRPFVHFWEAMLNMLYSQNSVGGFYMGQMVTDSLPWHWVPVNIITKTPLLYSVLFLCGVAALIVRAIRTPASLLTENRDQLLFFLWFAIPVFAVVVLDGRLFDEWRHLYFIYPGFLLVAVEGLRALCALTARLASEQARKMATGFLAVLCASSLMQSAIWMIRNHPLQYVYYSIPSRWVEGYFALDYWGISYRQGFEWILEHDDSDLITVAVTSSPGWENLNILTQEQRHRLVVQNGTFMTKYVLDDYRASNYTQKYLPEYKVHSIRVANMDVLGIYKNPYWNESYNKNVDRMEDFEVQERFVTDDVP